MKKGILKTLLVYGIGFGIAGIISLTVKKQDYNAPIHGPVLELEHLIILLTYIIGIVWSIISLFRLIHNPRESLKGIIVTNGFMILMIFVFSIIKLR